MLRSVCQIYFGDGKNVVGFNRIYTPVSKDVHIYIYMHTHTYTHTRTIDIPTIPGEESAILHYIS